MEILSFGSLNIDFVYSVDHFVRPGETLSALNLSKFCGGKGLNQSIALAKAGVNVHHAGKVGVDGDMLVKKLKHSGVDVSLVIADEFVPTGHAIIQVDKRGQNSIIICGGANQAITHDEVDAVLDNFVAGDLVLLQNEISPLDYIISQAHAKGMRIALNPSPMSPTLAAMPELKFVDLFILNETEGHELTGLDAPDGIVSDLFERFDGVETVLTLGKSGAVYSDGSRLLRHGIYDVTVADTTAAGDTFTGFFLASIVQGRSVEEALKRASVASSIAVSRNGASDSIPTSDEVETASLRPVDRD